MTKQVNPSLQLGNREEFVKQAMEAITKKQNEMIKQADAIIGDVVSFEKEIHKKFQAYIQK